MIPITFTVDGIPKGQPRPRASTRRFGNEVRAHVYDPGTAEGWKSLVAAAALPFRPSAPLDRVPIEVSFRFRLHRPQKLCRRKDPDCEIPALCTPDCDNLAKAALDVLTQIGWWRDDAQVARLTVEKVYHAKDGRPGADITICEMEQAGTVSASASALFAQGAS